MNLNKVFKSQCGQIIGEHSTITCEADVAGSLAGKSLWFYLKDDTGVERNYCIWFRVSGVGADPSPALYNSIRVNILNNATANQVAQAVRAALLAYTRIVHTAIIGGVDPDVTIECRWPFDTSDIADVDTGWASIVKDNDGSTVVATDLASAGGASAFVIRPTPRQIINVRKLRLSVADTDVTDGSKFGALTALTVGCALRVRDHDWGARLTLAENLITNADVISIGDPEILGTTMYIVEIDLVAAFGGPIVIDGYRDEDFCFEVNDDLTGIDGMYMTVEGNYQ